MSKLDPSEFRDHRFQNRLQTILLIVALLSLLGAIGWLLLGWLGMVIALLICGGTILFGQRHSPMVVLRMYRAKPITYQQAPELIQLFAAMAQRADLQPVPGLYYVPSRNPNAFAVGVEGNAAVAITDGLLRMMNRRELASILAHELAHIQHGDTRVMAVADSVSRMIGSLSQIALVIFGLGIPVAVCSGVGGIKMVLGGFLLLVSPLLSNFLQLALSRSREYDADLGAAWLTGDPRGLAAALSKLERRQPRSIFDIFFPGKRAPEPAMLRTHPPTRKRIERLLEIEIGNEEISPIETLADSGSRNRHLPPHQTRRIRNKPRIHRNGIWY